MAWWWSSNAVLSSTRPQSDSAAPTMATRLAMSPFHRRCVPPGAPEKPDAGVGERWRRVAWPRDRGHTAGARRSAARPPGPAAALGAPHHARRRGAARGVELAAGHGGRGARPVDGARARRGRPRRGDGAGRGARHGGVRRGPVPRVAVHCPARGRGPTPSSGRVPAGASAATSRRSSPPTRRARCCARSSTTCPPPPSSRGTGSCAWPGAPGTIPRASCRRGRSTA